MGEEDWDCLSDSVEQNIEFWAKLIPELDRETEGIVERIGALAKRLDRSQEETVAEHGISYGEWKVLHRLRRAEPDYRSTPGKLSEHLGISSGAMTNRLDRLEEVGLVRRLPDPHDRRSVVVELTDAGLERWQKATGRQAELEADIASTLGPAEKKQLDALLRRLLIQFEKRDVGSKRERSKQHRSAAA
jgi:DNA-binding MarR family transcriptional regulator